jgi:catechol 2,3-dioxygenase-like lactoylglutathione lyase family enzyme
MIRYSKLGYVELMVTDLERSAAFYREIVGLQPAAGARRRVPLQVLGRPYAVVLHQADRPASSAAAGCWRTTAVRGLHAGWRPRRCLRGAGADECQARGLARATRMVEPNTGATMEFYRCRPAP